MAAYLIVDTLLVQPDVYEQYKVRAKPLAEKFGGEYLVRGGDMQVRESDLWTPARMVVVKFPDAQAARDFYDSPEYQQVLTLGREGAKRTVVIVEGL